MLVDVISMVAAACRSIAGDLSTSCGGLAVGLTAPVPTRVGQPVGTSYTSTLPSAPAAAIRLPSGLNARSVTNLLSPSRVTGDPAASGVPLAVRLRTRHSHTRRSDEPPAAAMRPLPDSTASASA